MTPRRRFHSLTREPCNISPRLNLLQRSTITFMNTRAYMRHVHIHARVYAYGCDELRFKYNWQRMVYVKIIADTNVTISIFNGWKRIDYWTGMHPSAALKYFMHKMKLNEPPAPYYYKMRKMFPTHYVQHVNVYLLV